MTAADENILSVKIDPKTKALLEATLQAQSSFALFPLYLMACISSIVSAISWVGAVGVLLNVPYEAVTYRLDWYAVAAGLLLVLGIAVWALIWTFFAVRSWRTIKLYKNIVASQPTV